MSLADDVRFGSRMLLKQPSLTAIAVLALALGIGLTTTMFSIVNGALIHGLPFEESERIVAVSGTNQAENQDGLPVSIHDIADYREAQRSIESLAAMYTGTVNVSSEGRPDRFDGAFVTANTFDIVRVRPLLGRGFVTGDDSPGAPMTIVLGYGPWQWRFGGDRKAVGKVLRVNGRPATIIGVMPEKFAFPSAQEVWVPLQLDPLKLKRGEGQAVVPFGRLRPGITLEQERAEFGAIAKRLPGSIPRRTRIWARPSSRSCAGSWALRFSRCSTRCSARCSASCSAENVFKGEEPLGRQFREGRSDSKNPWLTVVGVAPDLYMDGPENEHPAGYYVPVAQGGARFMSIAVRATGDPLAFTSVVREQVAAVDPDLPIYFVRTLQDSLFQGAWPFRVFGALFMAFGFAAPFLATVGLYGVMAFSVRQRTQEIGVRMALGAAGSAVLGMFMRQGLRQIGFGLVLGLGLGAGLSRLMRTMLFRVQPWDPVVFSAIAVVLATSALIACFIPARRAMRVDPLVALRYE